LEPSASLPHMFIGHYAIALAAKKAVPRVSLGTTLCAAEFLDFVWPVLLLTGVEHFHVTPGITKVTPLEFYDYPYSHSLVFALGWSAVFGGAHFALKRDRRAALVLAAIVLSHWVCDAVVHRPDLPVLPRGPFLGLGVWNSVPGTLVLEGTMFLAGLWLYRRTTQAKDGVGRWGFGLFIAFTLAIYAGNVFGPPPPNESIVAWMGLSQWLLVAWAAWADRHRAIRV
jgi:hypothetical protein